MDKSLKNDIVKWHFWLFQTTEKFRHTRFFFASSRGKNKRYSKQFFFEF
jgi:hypothetical protein